MTSTKIDGKNLSAEQAATEEQLVRQHLPLVQYVVSEVAHRVPNHVSRSDLVSAGMLGLAQAARSFDPERGIAFDRFASTRIRGALLDELRGRDWASRSVRSRARGLQATQEELTNRLGRAPKPEEVARTLDVSPETVHKLVDDVHRATVLNYDSLVVEGDAESFIASTDDGPEDQLLDREKKAYLMDAVGALPERLRRVVIGYFFDERSMQDLADELGVSESRISQLRAEALLLLRCLEIQARSVSLKTVAGPGLNDTALAQSSQQRHGNWSLRLPRQPDSALGVPPRSGWRQPRGPVRRLRSCHGQCGVTVLLLLRRAGATPTGSPRSPASIWRSTGRRRSTPIGGSTKARSWTPCAEAKGEASAQLIEHLKKGDMAREAERLLDGTGWLPQVLRTPGLPLGSALWPTHMQGTARTDLRPVPWRSRPF